MNYIATERPILRGDDLENPGPDSAGQSGEVDLSLREILSTIQRRKYVLLTTVAVCVALAAAVLFRITPLYQAQTLILIEPEGNRPVIMDTMAGGLLGDLETVRSETYILKSAAVADRVIDRLDLVSDPEFNPEPEPQSGFLSALYSRARSSLLALLGMENSDKREHHPVELDQAIRQSKLVNRFKKALQVGAIEDSRVISVQFQSTDPRKAQTIANSVAREYLQLREELKLESTSQVTNWLDDQIGELQAIVENGEAAIESLRQEHGLVSSDRGDLGSQELAQVSTQLIMVRAERAESEVRLQQVQRLLQSPDGINSASEVLDSPVIQGLRAQETELQARIAELSTELGEQHPRMLQLRAEANEIEAKIAAEIDNIVAGLRNQVNVARARERSFKGALEDIKGRVARSNENQIEIRALEREVESNRALLTNLLNRQKQTAPQEDSRFLQADARIISMAELPTVPTYPNKKVALALAFFASLLLGFLFILLLELLDNGFRSIEQLDAQTGVAALGFIPQVKLGRHAESGVNFLIDNPSSAFAESIRTLDWSIKLAFPDSPPKVVLITSSLPNEGKSTVASSLCFTQGRTGKRALLIDADIRRPSIHNRFEIERTPGLIEYLAGEATIDEVTEKGHSAWGVTVIPAGDLPIDVPNLLASDRMNDLLETLRWEYDLIVIDSPPVMVGAEVRLLGRMADATLMVVRWGKTPRQTVKHSLKNLRTSGVTLAGTVLTMVNVKKYSKYTYGDAGAYAGDLAKYYARL